MLTLYLAWNEEDFTQEAKLFEDFFKMEEHEQGITEDQMKETEQINENQKLKLQQEQKTLSTLVVENEKLKAELKLLKHNEEEQANVFESRQRELDRIYKINEQLDKDKDSLMDKKMQEEKDINNIKADVARQPMSADQRDKKLQIINENKAYIAQLDKHLNEIRNYKYKMDLKLLQLNKNLTEAIDKYRSIVYSEQNEKVDNISFDMTSLEIPVMAVSEINPDIIKDKIDKINKMENSFKHECEKVQLQIESIRNQIVIVKDDANYLKLCREENAKRLKKIEDEIQNIKQNFAEREIQITKDMEKLIQQKNEVVKKIPYLDLPLTDVKVAEDKVDALNQRKVFIEEKVNSFFTEFHKINKQKATEIEKMLSEFKL